VGILGRVVLPPVGADIHFLPLPTEPATERENVPAAVGSDRRRAGGGDRLCRNLWRDTAGPIASEYGCGVGVATALALALGLATVQRNAQYHSAESIWADVVAKRPDSLRGHANLGLALLDDGRAKESIPHFVDALHIDPNQPTVRCNLANASGDNRRDESGDRRMQETIRHAPSRPGPRGTGRHFRESGDAKSALEQYAAALAINPDEQVAHFQPGPIAHPQGQREGAIAQFTEVLAAGPEKCDGPTTTSPICWPRAGARPRPSPTMPRRHGLIPATRAACQINLGNLFLKLGRSDDAIVAYTDALRADPNAFKAHK